MQFDSYADKSDWLAERGETLEFVISDGELIRLARRCQSVAIPLAIANVTRMEQHLYEAPLESLAGYASLYFAPLPRLEAYPRPRLRPTGLLGPEAQMNGCVRLLPGGESAQGWWFSHCVSVFYEVRSFSGQVHSYDDSRRLFGLIRSELDKTVLIPTYELFTAGQMCATRKVSVSREAAAERPYRWRHRPYPELPNYAKARSTQFLDGNRELVDSLDSAVFACLIDELGDGTLLLAEEIPIAEYQKRFPPY